MFRAELRSIGRLPALAAIALVAAAAPTVAPAPHHTDGLLKLDKGLQKAWNEADSLHRSAMYTALAPGNYVFREQGSNHRGASNEKGASVPIQILPPYWSERWFGRCAMALVAILLWTAYHLRVRRIQGRNRELERAEREIQALNERLIRAQDEERARIARELHDDLSQQIAALAMSVSTLKQHMTETDPETRDHTDRLQQKIVRLGQSTRQLAHQLHPALLEHAGVATALRSYCSEFSTRNRLDVSCGAEDVSGVVSPAAALCLFRVTQEALQNVAQHAGAKRADVHLIRTSDFIALSISDDGVGCSTDRSRSSGGLGLVSMKERVRLVKGTFEFISEPKRGTTVEVRIPIENEPHSNQS